MMKFGTGVYTECFPESLVSVQIGLT